MFWPDENFLHMDADGGAAHSCRAGDGYYSDPGEIRDHDELEPMQFTGLTDRDGRDIYEGDLLKHNPHSDLLQVEFRDGAFGVIDLTCPANGWAALCDKNPVNASEWEIVGNIHENPELIPA